jgi:Transposase
MPMKTLTSPFARPRWTEKDAPGALAALQRSGKSVRAFSTEHGLDPQRLYSWKRRLGGAEPTTFQEVIVRPAPRISLANGHAPFEVVLPSGVIIRVPASFDAEALERVLGVLRTDAC